MKSNKWNLMTACIDFIAGICFGCAAALQEEMLITILYSIASAGLLIGGIRFFCAYRNKRKNNHQGSN